MAAPARDPSSTPTLADLPPLLRSEPGLTHAFGDPQALVAVPEAARAIAIAALSQLGGRRPLAGRVPDRQRRRPAVRRPPPVPARRTRWCCSRRGRRCRSSGSARASRRWAGGSRCCGGCATPTACRRSSSPACARCCRSSARAPPTVEPICVAPGDVLDADELLRTPGRVRLPPRGAGRAPRRGRPARRDHRRLPVDRRRADPHRPVGRRGRPAHRVHGQRPAQHRRPRPRR